MIDVKLMIIGVSLLALLGVSGCGSPTRVVDYRNIEKVSDLKFSMLEDSRYSNRLRIQLQQKGISVTPIHATITGNLLDRNIKAEGSVDYYLKFTFELNRPCIAPPSLLGTGTVDVISAKNNRLVLQIQEEGFDEACLGSYALYGNLFDELAESIKVQVLSGSLKPKQ